jgi:hypothetical protein
VIKDALNQFRADHSLPDTGNIRSDLLYIAREARELFNHNPLMAKLTTKVIADKHRKAHRQ